MHTNSSNLIGATPLEPAEKYELYNLAVDISECRDLTTKEPERLATLRATLKELLSGAVPPGNLVDA